MILIEIRTSGEVQKTKWQAQTRIKEEKYLKMQLFVLFSYVLPVKCKGSTSCYGLRQMCEYVNIFCFFLKFSEKKV